jgi:hypothetical protein
MSITDNSTNLIQFIISAIIGTGVIAALINLVANNKAESRKRRAELLTAQIQALYGPLQFFTSQNEALFALQTRIHTAGDQTYGGRALSEAESSQELPIFFETVNAYTSQVMQNNSKIVEIMGGNYAHIDPDDVEVFSRFLVDVMRLRTERDESGCYKLRLDVYDEVGEISFMRNEFIVRVREKFNLKKRELERLSR